MNSTFQRDDLMPKTADGTGRGFALATLVHIGLIVAITFGVSWRASEPEGVEAELWAAVPQVAAQRDVAPPPEPTPKPVPKVEPKPEPKPEPAPPLPKVQAPDPQIAIEKEKQEKAKKVADAKREQDEKDKADKKKALEEKAKLAKAEADKLAKAEEQLAAQREANIKRILGDANASANTGAAGNAKQTKGASAGYGGRIISHLKSFNNFIESVPGSPRTEVEIRVGPTGAILGKRITKSSGVPSWDDSVMRTLDKAERLPLDTDGSVQNPTIITWGPND